MDEVVKAKIKKSVENKDVKSLISFLTDKNMDARRTAAEALGNLKDERAVEPLIQALKDTKDYPVVKLPLQVPALPIDARIEAALALGKIGGNRAFAALQEIKDKHTVKGYYRGLLFGEAIEKALSDLNASGPNEEKAKIKDSSKKWWHFWK
ncbi:MAG: HEAT repeat domain-containing protein [Bacteroidales bacterium]|nr:HEAT repeat domain-containing protein [Bacteroidales bacterium]